MTFNTWLDTFVTEKNINVDRILEVEGASGVNMMPVRSRLGRDQIRTGKRTSRDQSDNR